MGESNGESRRRVRTGVSEDESAFILDELFQTRLELRTVGDESTESERRILPTTSST